MTTIASTSLGYSELKEILPHTYPFLLIDKVIEFKKDESLVAVKNITVDEWVFGQLMTTAAVFPEVLLIEAAAQAALVLYCVSRVEAGAAVPLFVLGKVKAEFNKEVVIGDRLELRANSGKMLATGGYADVDIFVGQEKCGHVELIYGVRR